MTIELTTREDLIDTLHLAAELEHNLMCQYLFAAYSMKRSTSEGLSEVQLEKTRGCKKSQESQDVRKESGPAGMAGVVRRRA